MNNKIHKLHIYAIYIYATYYTTYILRNMLRNILLIT